MVFKSLKARFPRIKRNEPLKNHCTFRVGGPTDYFYELLNIEELPALITLAEENEIPYLMIGRGSNILFRDKGFRGLIIKNLTNNFRIENENIIATSGVLLSALIQKSVETDLAGLEPLYGIPGTIGGAVYGNAGVPKTEIKDFVEKVTVFNIEEGIHDHFRDELAFEYRGSLLKKENKDAVMYVTLRLKKGNKDRSKEAMKTVDMIRRGKQPVGFTAGSFFKNTPRGPAGYLVDQTGLKGTKIGDAQISEKHGNFFMNLGNATASQILELAEFAKKKVKEKFGIELEEEVRIFGDRDKTI